MVSFMIDKPNTPTAERMKYNIVTSAPVDPNNLGPALEKVLGIHDYNVCDVVESVVIPYTALKKSDFMVGSRDPFNPTQFYDVTFRHGKISNEESGAILAEVKAELAKK